MSKFKAIEPSVYPWHKYSDYTFSLGLATETDAFISGHTASTFNAETGRMVVVGGMTDQVNIAYDKIECILEAAGMTFADITRVVENVTVSGLPHYAEAQAVRIARFNGHTPTITTVMVDALLRPEAFIEIEVCFLLFSPFEILGLAKTASNASRAEPITKGIESPG